MRLTCDESPFAAVAEGGAGDGLQDALVSPSSGAITPARSLPDQSPSPGVSRLTWPALSDPPHWLLPNLGAQLHPSGCKIRSPSSHQYTLPTTRLSRSLMQV